MIVWLGKWKNANWYLLEQIIIIAAPNWFKVDKIIIF